MRTALDLAAAAADAGEVPVGAVIYHTPTGDTIATGANERESHHDPRPTQKSSPSAAPPAPWEPGGLTDCTLVVTLEPCPMCAGACVNARIPRVVYGADDPKAGASRTLYRITDDPRLNHRCAVIPGVLADQCADILRRFFRARRVTQPATGDGASAATDA